MSQATETQRHRGHADPERKPHRLEDHLLGMDSMHSHEDGEADHDHDHDDRRRVNTIRPATSLWLQDNITLLSVGIDIGSAGTQVIFSRIAVAPVVRGADEPLLRRRTRDDVSVAGGAHAISQRGADRRPGDRRDRRRGLRCRRPASGRRRHRGRHPDGRGACGARTRNRLPTCWPRWAASSSARPQAITWSRCSRRTALERRRCRTIAAAAILNIDIGGGTTKLALVDHGNVVHTAALHHRRSPGGDRRATVASRAWILPARGWRRLPDVTGVLATW